MFPMIAFEKFTNAETTARKFLRQVFFRKMKNNFDDHETRILQVEQEIRMRDHFHARKDMRIGNPDDGIATDLGSPYQTQAFDPQRWQVITGRNDFGIDTNAQTCFAGWPATRANAVGYEHSHGDYSGDLFPTHTSAQICLTGVYPNDIVHAISRLQFNEGIDTKPFTYEGRFKWDHTNIGSDPQCRWGLGIRGVKFAHESSGPTAQYEYTGRNLLAHANELKGGTPGAYNTGIWLERSSQSQARFRMWDGSFDTLGTTFAKPLARVWFWVKVVWQANDSIECWLDTGSGYVLKETFTSDQPFGQNLAAWVAVLQGPNGEDASGGNAQRESRFEIDLVDWKAEGLGLAP